MTTFRYVEHGADRVPGTATVHREGNRVLVHLWDEHECSCALGAAHLVVGEDVTLVREAPGRWTIGVSWRSNSAALVDVPEPAPWTRP